jgi:hypothetical protein
MPYIYEEQKKNLCTPENIDMLLKIRDRAKLLINTAGACSVDKLLANISGDSWLMLAAVELLAERGELTLVYDTGATQDRVYK